MVASEVLCRKDLSMKAKGMFAYLFSKPQGWEFSAERIALECTEGRKGVLAILKELENIGLLSRRRRSDGKVDYNIEYTNSQSPHEGLRVDKPKSPMGTEPDGHGAERGPISNMERDSKKENDSKIKTPEQSSGADIGEVIHVFEVINPACKNFYGNPNQRKACDQLIQSYTYDRVISVITKTLPRTNVIPYLPNITTPMQLRDRWSSLEAGILKMKNKGVVEKKGKTVSV